MRIYSNNAYIRNEKTKYLTVTSMDLNTLVQFNENQRFEPVFNQKFRRLQTKVTYEVNHNFSSNVTNFLEVSEAIDQEYERIVHYELEQVPDCAFFSVSIDSEDLATPIFIPPHKPSNFHKEDFANTIARVLNSNQDFLLTQKLSVTFTHVLHVSGSGRAPKKIGERIKYSKSVLQIENSDNSCLLRAVAIGKYISIHGKDKGWKAYSRINSRPQTEDAKQIALDCNLEFNSKLNLSHLEKIDAHFGSAFRIVVFEQENKHNRLFEGTKAAKTIYLEYVNDHFDVITNIRRYLANTNEICEHCFKSFPFNRAHYCKLACDRCNGEQHPKVTQEEFCKDCNRFFYGNVCFENHLVLLTCNKRKCCPICNVDYPTNENLQHVCGLYSCPHCKEEYKEQPHHCFIKTLDKNLLIEKDHKFPMFYIFYDIESVTADGDSEKKMHTPILLITRMCCDSCYNYSEKSTSACNICVKEKVFYSPRCISDFVEYLIEVAKTIEKKKGNLLVFAHYGKGYDLQFVLREVIAQRYTPEPVCQGLKILYMKLGNIRFIDSFSFLMQSLKSLPATFGFKDLVEKGEFPHNLNDLNYRGKLPSIEHYGTQNMLPKAAEEVQRWHAQHSEKDFDFKNEMIAYCSKDVLVLMLAVMTFKDLFSKITNLNPFTRNFTLASAGFECIRSSFLKPNFMHKTPSPPVYFYNKRTSKIANIWLDMLDNHRRVKLLREYRIGNYFVDGADPPRKIAYEFTGCYYHGCPCIKKKRDAQKYTQLYHRFSMIERMGWEIEEMKECNFRKQYGKTAFFKLRYDHYTRLIRFSPCNIAEAFFGGRCTNFSFVRECEPDEKIEYFDVVSEYPYCLKYRTLPFGVPQEVSSDFDYTLESYPDVGFAKVCILPPKRLLFPVLPARINKKQVYTLCKTCARDEQQSECKHNDEQRCLINTYTLVELKEALKRGYKILWITQILTYKETAENPYKDYVDLFLKIKQEASGWPEWVKTEHDEDTYLDQYFEREGIKLDKKNIKFNAGLRFIAKIFLNSSWGKLAQRRNMTSVSICNTLDDHRKLLNDESIIILGEVAIGNNSIIVSWRYKEMDDSRSINTNLAVAAYTTAWARLHLYKFMRMVEEIHGGENLLYIDTDSLIYVRKRNAPPLPTGSFLGDLTDEFPGCEITKFASTGSKSYCLEYTNAQNQTKSIIKVKGIKLTVSALESVNLKEIINLAAKFVNGETLAVQVPQFEIRPTNKHEIYSRYFLKRFKPTSTKRMINAGKTLPYGYV